MSVSNMNKPSGTDWARLDAMTDDEIDTSDIPPLTEEFFARAVLRMPDGPRSVAVQLDPDLLDWYRAQGADGVRLLNEALRQYIAGQATAYDSPIHNAEQ